MDFMSLDAVQKRTKLLVLLEQLQSAHEVFAEILAELKQAERVPVDILDSIYAQITDMNQKIQQKNKNVQADLFQQSQSIVKQIQQAERLEEEENDADSLLDNL